MRFVFSLLFSLIIFGASFQNTLFVIDYKINRDFYEIHCINKANEQLDCHGKCQVREESEKTSTPFNLVKYSFEFNILPPAPVVFFIAKEAVPEVHPDNFSYHGLSFQDFFPVILPNPPQV